MHPVKLSLYISCLCLIFFIGFGVTVNEISRNYEAKINEVKRSEDFAQKRLSSRRKELISQRNRVDSLEVIVEAKKRKEILWMARALYSETKRPHEMWHVGWVIRNRFESGFRSKGTYKSVILYPKQFSAFNRGSPLRDYYLRLQPEDAGEIPRWHEALATAKRVIEAPEAFRPFPKDTYHFYSRRSMIGEPYWKKRLSPVKIASVESNRFNFLRGSTTASTLSKIQK